MAFLAPSLTTSPPKIFVAYPIQRFLSARLPFAGRNIVPKSSPLKILFITQGIFPFAIRTFPPNLVTSFAASNLVLIPPLPPSEASVPSFKTSSVTASTSFISSASGFSLGLEV